MTAQGAYGKTTQHSGALAHATGKRDSSNRPAVSTFNVKRSYQLPKQKTVQGRAT
jgi:hypothetical protein